MRSRAHLAVGLLSGTTVASFISNSFGIRLGLNPMTGAALLTVLLGSLLPDIDTEKSPISRMIPLIPNLIQKRFTHRTLTHSLFGLACLAAGFFLLLFALSRFLALFGIHISISHLKFLSMLLGTAIFSHHLLDCLTISGTPFLYPLIQESFGYPSHEIHRLDSDDKRAEIIISVVSLVLFAWFLPTARDGAETSLRNAIGRFRQLHAIYNDVVNQEVVLQYDGYSASNKSPISGKALILSATPSTFIALMDGKVLEIGQSSGDIRLVKGTCRALDIAPKDTSWKVVDEKLADIIDPFDEDVRISGDLHANMSFEVVRPINNQTLSVSATSLELEFASVADIFALGIKPKVSGHTLQEIERTLPGQQLILDSLLELRSNSVDLYRRQTLLEEITEKKKALKKLQSQLEQKSSEQDKLLFSGTMSVRFIPPF